MGYRFRVLLPRVLDILPLRSDLFLQERGHPRLIAAVLDFFLRDSACHRIGNTEFFHTPQPGCGKGHHANKLPLLYSRVPRSVFHATILFGVWGGCTNNSNFSLILQAFAIRCRGKTSDHYSWIHSPLVPK